MATLDTPEDDFFNSYLKSSRFRYAMGIAIFALLNLLLYLVMLSLFTAFDVDSVVITYIGTAIVNILAITLGLLIYDKFIGEKGHFLLLNPKDKVERQYLKKMTVNRKSILGLFVKKFTFSHFFTQLRDALILLCVVYIPLDFISYQIPGVLQYQYDSLVATEAAAYIVDPSIITMLLTSLVLHFFIALREESIFRGIHISLGEWELNPSTTLFYSSMLFGLAHFNYILGTNVSVFFPIWWGINAILIGTVSAYYFIQKHKIWPILLAHWFNNVLSSVVTRNYVGGLPFSQSFLLIYLPVFIIGFGLLVAYTENILKHLKKFSQLVMGYFSQFYDVSAEGIKQWNRKKTARYMITDLLLLIFLWLLMMLI